MSIYSIVLLVGIVITAAIGYLIRSLTFSGAIATIIIGFLVFLGYGAKGLLMLGIFFASSSLLSFYKKERKKSAQEKNEKSEQRDLVQVFANGAIPAFISVLSFYLYGQISNPLLIVMFLAAISTANADTWASEIGPLSKQRPFHVFRFRRVDAGTSGAVSLLGTIAGFAGAFLIGLSGFIFFDEISGYLMAIVIISGFIGHFIDTLLGATVQVSYECRRCHLETEKTIHCEQRTIKKNGCTYINNDIVNLTSICTGALLSVLIYIMI